MFYNYFKIINYYIENKDQSKINKISKINEGFINKIKQIRGGNPEEEINPIVNQIDSNISEINTIFSEIIEKLKNKRDFTEEELTKIKGTIELINRIKSNIGEITDVKQIRDQLDEINKILIETITN
jgi:hypothetical protein